MSRGCRSATIRLAERAFFVLYKSDIASSRYKPVAEKYIGIKRKAAVVKSESRPVAKYITAVIKNTYLFISFCFMYDLIMLSCPKLRLYYLIYINIAILSQIMKKKHLFHARKQK